MTENNRPSADQTSTGPEKGKEKMEKLEALQIVKEYPEAVKAIEAALIKKWGEETGEKFAGVILQISPGMIKTIDDSINDVFSDLPPRSGKNERVQRNLGRVKMRLAETVFHRAFIAHIVNHIKGTEETQENFFVAYYEILPFLEKEMQKAPEGEYMLRELDIYDRLTLQEVLTLWDTGEATGKESQLIIDAIRAAEEDEKARRDQQAQKMTRENSVLSNPYLPMHHNPITDLLTLWYGDITQRDERTGNIVITNAETSAALMVRGAKANSRPSINTHKLLGVAISEFTKVNHFSRSTKERKLTKEISIPFDEYARQCNYKIDPLPTDNEEEEQKEKKRVQGRRKEARKQIMKDLDMLGGVFIQYRVKKKNITDSLTQLNLIEWTSISDNFIRIKFTETAAALLSRSPLMQYPRVLLGISAKNPNAYSIAYKMSVHYNNDNNIIKGTNDRLKVTTLLKETTWPTYSYLQETGNGRHWEDRIKEPFEKALDMLTGVYISEWEYVKAKGVQLDDQEAAAITSYEIFSNLYVKFRPIDAPEHQEERRQRRAIEKEEALKNREKKPKRQPKKKAGRYAKQQRGGKR